MSNWPPGGRLAQANEPNSNGGHPSLCRISQSKHRVLAEGKVGKWVDSASDLGRSLWPWLSSWLPLRSLSDCCRCHLCRIYSAPGFPGGSDVKHLPAMRETWVCFLGREDPLEKEIAIHPNKESDTTERLHFHFHFILHQALGSLFLSELEVIRHSVNRGRDKDSKLRNFFQVTVIRGEQEFWGASRSVLLRIALCCPSTWGRSAQLTFVIQFWSHRNPLAGGAWESMRSRCLPQVLYWRICFSRDTYCSDQIKVE